MLDIDRVDLECVTSSCFKGKQCRLYEQEKKNPWVLQHALCDTGMLLKISIADFFLLILPRRLG